MKQTEIEKLREKKVVELQKDLFESQDKLRVLGFDLARGKVKNSSAVRNMKKRIATLFTLINEKENIGVVEKE